MFPVARVVYAFLLSTLVGTNLPRAPASEVTLVASSDQTSSIQNEVFHVKLEIDIAEHWHIGGKPRSSQEVLDWQPTLVASKTPGVEVGVFEIVWPEEKIFQLYGNSVPGYEKHLVLSVPLRISRSVAAGMQEIEVEVSGLACSEQACLPFREMAKLKVEIIQARLSWASILEALAKGFLGGLFLNLMPCVVPVLGLKFAMLKRAASSQKELLVDIVMLVCGLMVFWGGLGLLLAGFSQVVSLNFLVQLPGVGLVFGIVFAVLGLMMLDKLPFTLPGFVYEAGDKASKGVSTAFGAFMFGAFIGLLSTPCSAPFMGVAAAWALGQSSALLVALTFSAIGLGMGAPYLLFVKWPGLIAWTRKGGAVGAAVKALSGWATLAFAPFFAWVGVQSLLKAYPFMGETLGLWGGCLILLGAVVWSFNALRDSLMPRWLRGVTLLLCVTSFVSLSWFAWNLTRIDWVLAQPTEHGKWKVFATHEFEEARASGQTVVVDFSADSCLSCKALEALVLHTADFEACLEKFGASAFAANISRDERAESLLHSLGQRTVPVVAVYGPGLEKPECLAGLFTTEQLAALVERAAQKDSD